jgi:putative hemolysin
VEEASEALAVELPEGEYDSLAGLLYDRLGVVPKTGADVELEEVTFTVKELDGLRIARVQARLHPRPAEENGRDGRGNHRGEG